MQHKETRKHIKFWKSKSSSSVTSTNDPMFNANSIFYNEKLFNKAKDCEETFFMRNKRNLKENNSKIKTIIR